MAAGKAFFRGKLSLCFLIQRTQVRSGSETVATKENTEMGEEQWQFIEPAL